MSVVALIVFIMILIGKFKSLLKDIMNFINKDLFNEMINK